MSYITPRPSDRVLQTLEAATGLAISDGRDLKGTLGRLAQSMWRQDFGQQFRREYEELRNKGRIPDSFGSSEVGKSCLYEMLDYLDSGDHSQVTFDLLKSIFFAAATTTIEEERSILAKEYLRIAKTLSSAELLVLRGCYLQTLVVQKGLSRPPHISGDAISYGGWLKEATTCSKLVHEPLVDMSAAKLIEKGLLCPRVYPDKSGISVGTGFGVTTLGMAIMQYAETYDNEPPATGCGPDSRKEGI